MPLPYQILIEPGVLTDAEVGAERAWALVREVLDASRYAIICDATVGERYPLGDTQAFGEHVTWVLVPPGEESKSRESWTAITDRMLADGCGRDAAVVAVGGGVVSDLAGFVAATFARGIPYALVPTTLVGMVDASIGGKTAVHAPAGKNLIGAFHQPSLVVIDPLVLASLPPREVRQGIAEALKHGAVLDEQYFTEVSAIGHHLQVEGIGATMSQLPALIRRSIAIKEGVVLRDPEERGERAVLNFGHTVAHAVEAESCYAIPHGDAVAMGMVCEAMIGERIGITFPGTAERLRWAIERAGLPAAVPTSLSIDALVARMKVDKKARRGATRFSLIRGIGVPLGPTEWTVPVEDAEIVGALWSQTVDAE